MNTNKVTAAHEQVVRVQNGWAMLILLITALLADSGLMVFSFKDGVETTGEPHGGLLAIAIVALPIIVVLMTGFFTLQPNQARVLVLFGAYKGTVRTPGFHWGNPFYSNGPQQAASWRANLVAAKAGANSTAGQRPLGRNKISLRARTLNGDKLKVNDKRGNPIEIAAVVVWRVEDAAHASGIRSGNRAGNVAAAAGGSRDRRAHQDRAGRSEQGGHGAERAVGKV